MHEATRKNIIFQQSILIILKYIHIISGHFICNKKELKKLMTDLEIKLTVKLQQQFLLSVSMQKALCILQLPVMELNQWLEEELSANPVLEKIEVPPEEEGWHSRSDHKSSADLSYLADATAQTLSLYQHLMNQSALIFSRKEDLWMAEQIIGNLDEKGFFTEIPEDLRSLQNPEKIQGILQEIQRMDPPGIAAQSTQESLLLQLTALEKKDTVTYWVIENYYKELLEQKFSFLEQKCHLPACRIKAIIKKEVSLLDPCPGLRFREKISQPLIPDVILEKIEGNWQIQIHESIFSHFRLNPDYQSLYPNLSRSDQKFIIKHHTSAQWISRSIQQRNSTLIAIVQYMIKKQAPFFDLGNNELLPMTYEELASSLGVHQSTIARAVSQKYLFWEQGTLPLKFFFSGGCNTQPNPASSHNAKQLLQKMIQEENRNHPLSDTELVQKMRSKGFPCARRTITKYRNALQIAPSSKRKFSDAKLG